MLYFGKSAVNPFIYGWKNKDLRRALVRLVKRKKNGSGKVDPLSTAMSSQAHASATIVHMMLETVAALTNARLTLIIEGGSCARAKTAYLHRFALTAQLGRRRLFQQHEKGCPGRENDDDDDSKQDLSRILEEEKGEKQDGGQENNLRLD